MYNTITHHRPAIAMIELIFAIMVMGIVMMSVPQLLNVSSSSGYVAIQQEGINEAATQANIMLGYEWDENNTVEGHKPVLNTNGVVALNGTIPKPKRRAGTPMRSHRLFISYDGKEFNASAIGLDPGETLATKDDIDDFNNTSTNLVLDGAAAGTTDYIEKNTISISRSIAYISDAETGAGTYTNGGGGTLTYKPNFFAPTANTTNIKSVTVTLTSTSAETELNTKKITFYAFSCNIGSYELEEK